MTVVVPRGATSDAGENPYAEKLPISPRTINIRPTLQTDGRNINKIFGVNQINFHKKKKKNRKWVLTF